MPSGRYVLKRALQALGTLFVIVTLLFFLFRLGLPDPTAALVSQGFNPEDRAVIRERFGLDRPLLEQYVLYLRNIVQGDFGTSFYYNAPVGSIIWEKFGNTMVLMIVAIIAAYGLGIPLGAWLSWRRGRPADTAGIILGLMFRSAPMFWTGMMAVLIFGVTLGWLPTSGMRTLPYEAAGFFDKIMTPDFLLHLIMPSLVIALF